MTFGLLFSDTETVTISAEDAGSGVDKVYYFLSDTAISTVEELEELAGNAWIEENSFSKDPVAKFIVYAKAVDKAGNIRYANSQGIILQGDATASMDSSVSGVTIDGLEIETKEIQQESADGIQNVHLNITVERPTEGTEEVLAIQKAAPEKKFEFLSLHGKQTVGEVTTDMTETQNVLKISIPYEKTGKKEVMVYGWRDGAVQPLRKREVPVETPATREDGTFYVDTANQMVYVYTKQLTTYAIGYTVYCRVETEVSLGSYTGTVTATLQDATGEVIAKQENMPQNQIIFSSVPRGKYEVVVEWEDGVDHSMRIPVEVK